MLHYGVTQSLNIKSHFVLTLCQGIESKYWQDEKAVGTVKSQAWLVSPEPFFELQGAIEF